MNMKVNPTNKEVKPEVEQAIKKLDAAEKYRYSLYVDRQLMADYLNVCKKRRVKAPEEITAFIVRELNRFDEIT